MKYKVDFDIELKKNTYPGLYIGFEGIDGSGKTTQVDMLAEYFEKQGREVLKTHEPRRDTVVGKLVFEILEAKIELPAVSLQYLFAADRAIHQELMVVPALKEGKVVISDRTLWSSIPYGLLDRAESEHEENGDRLSAALSLLSMYHEFVVADYTVFLDVTTEAATKRLVELGKKASIYEKKEKLEKIKEGYDWLFEKFPSEFTKINGELPLDQVAQEIIQNIPKK